MNRNLVRIFVSSPADVDHERAIVKEIIEHLAREFLPYFEIQPVLWEEEALTADRSFQAGLVKPADCDIVLVVLWTRLGSPLPQQPYGGMTGTEWEFFSAIQGMSVEGAPEVLVYKKNKPKLIDITDIAAAEEAIAARARLEAFFQRNFFNEDRTFRRAFRSFDNDASFRNLVEVQLRKLLNRRIFADQAASGRASDWQGSPFRPSRPYGTGDERIFIGRETETRDLVRRLQEQMAAGQGLVVLSGASGCGKTSLVRAGLIPRLARPYQIDGVSICRWCLVDPEAGSDPLDALAAALCSGEALGEGLAGHGIDRARLRDSLARDPARAASQVGGALQELARTLERESNRPGGGARLLVVMDPLEAALKDAVSNRPEPQAGERDPHAPPRQEPSSKDGPDLAPCAAALAALAATGQVWVLAVIRSDHLGLMPRLGALAEGLAESAWLRLEPPAGGRLRQIMEIPALVAGLRYEGEDTHGVVDHLEAEASRLAHWPALLEGALEDLYQARTAAPAPPTGNSLADAHPSGHRQALTLAALRQNGGIAGHALRRAERLWETLDPLAQGALPMLCRALATFERKGDRRPIPRRADLETLERDPACRALVRAMVAARLLVAQGERDPVLFKACHLPDHSLAAWLERASPVSAPVWVCRRPWGRKARGRMVAVGVKTPGSAQPAGAPDQGPGADGAWGLHQRTLEIAHPVFLTDFRPCRDWLSREENRQVLRLRGRIARQAQLWKRTDCNQEYLLGETGFAAATGFARAYGQELEPLEAEFLRHSEIRLHVERRRRALARVTGMVLVALLVLATAAAIMAREASRKATVNLHLSRLEAAELAIVRGDTPTAVVLALDAGPYLPQQAQETLSRAFTLSRLIAMVHEGPPVPGWPLAAAIDDDGRTVVTVDPAVGVRRWELEGNRFLAQGDPVAYEQGLQRVLFAGDGTRSGFYSIAPEGVWRLPVAPGSGFPCGAQREDGLALAPGGRLLAISHALAPDRFAVCLLDLARPGEPLFDRELHTDRILSVAFSPDGTRLVTASRDGTAKVIASAGGAVLGTLAPRVEGGLDRARFDPGGRSIAVAARDGTPRLYGLDGRLLRRLGGSGAGGEAIHKSGIRDLAFTPDGRSLLTADEDGLVVRWDLHDGEAVGQVLGHHRQAVVRLEVAPDGRRLLTASLDKTARLWDIPTGRELAVFSHRGAVTEASFSAGGERVFTQSATDGTARLWSLEPHARSSRALPHPGQVRHLAFGPGRRGAPEVLRLATAGADGGIRVFAFDRRAALTGPVAPVVLEGHTAAVQRVVFAADGERLASAGDDGIARIWALGEHPGERDRALCRLEVGGVGGRAGEGTGAAMDDARAADARASSPGGSHEEAVRSIGIGVGPTEVPAEVGQTPRDEGEPVRVHQVLFDPAPAGRWLLTTSDSAAAPVALWDQETCNRIEVPELGAGGSGVPAAAVARTPRGTLVATGSDSGQVRVVVETPAGAWEPLCDLPLHTRAVRDLALSPDGRWLVSGSEDRLARLVPIAAPGCGEPIDLAGHTDTVASARFAPDGALIVTASLDTTARVWDTQGALRLILSGHKDAVEHAEFSPDGRFILTASRDGTIRFWQTPRPSARDARTPYLVLTSDYGGLSWAAFGPRGRYIGAAYAGEVALLWQIWADGEDLAPAQVARLEAAWGKERARLALIREAVRFREENRLDELDSLGEGDR